MVAAFNTRGNAYNAQGEFDPAIADFTKAVELSDFIKAVDHSSDKWVYVRNLALAKFNKGDFTGAAAELARVVESNPSDNTHSVLLRYLALTRAGEAGHDHLVSDAAKLSSKNWPYPIVELYLGKIPVATVLEAGSKVDNRCSNGFYVGRMVHSAKEPGRS